MEKAFITREDFAALSNTRLVAQGGEKDLGTALDSAAQLYGRAKTYLATKDTDILKTDTRENMIAALRPDVRADPEALTAVIAFGERLRPFPTQMWAYNRFEREPELNHIFIRQGNEVVARADMVRDLLFISAALLDPDPNNARAEEARYIFTQSYNQLGLGDFARDFAAADRNAALTNANITAGPLHALLGGTTPHTSTQRILDKTTLTADDRDFLIGLNSALQGCFLTAKSTYDAYVFMKMPEKAQDALKPLVTEARLRLLREAPPLDIKTATPAEVMAHPDTLTHPHARAHARKPDPYQYGKSRCG